MFDWNKIIDDIIDSAMGVKKQESTTEVPQISSSKYNGEKVLVFKTSIIELSDNFEGFIEGQQAKLFREKYLIPSNLFYIDRDLAENDPSYKQVIPYCFISKPEEIFYYERSKKGSEERLHNLCSLGVGGHINPCDGNNEETLSLACKRELDEEISYEGFKGSSFVGLINDNSDPVNSVHFGVVFHIKLDHHGKVEPKEAKLINKNFVDKKRLITEDINWEKWSALLLRGYIRNNF